MLPWICAVTQSSRANITVLPQLMRSAASDCLEASVFRESSDALIVNPLRSRCSPSCLHSS